MAQACLGIWALCQIIASDASTSDEAPPADPPDPPAAEVTDAPVNDWPIGGAFGARLYCIESHESSHSGDALNRQSGAQGWLQWLPATARQFQVIVGNRRSEWNAAARIHAISESFFRSQWPVTARLCP